MFATNSNGDRIGYVEKNLAPSVLVLIKSMKEHGDYDACVIEHQDRHESTLSCKLVSTFCRNILIIAPINNFKKVCLFKIHISQ